MFPCVRRTKKQREPVVEFLKDRGEKKITIAEGATWGSTAKGIREHGYEELIRDYGFGEGDLKNIQVVGDSVDDCRKTYKMSHRFLRMRRQESKGQLQQLAEYAR